MTTILPIQLVFDKEIPEAFGNFEYRQEHALLVEIDRIITLGGLERPVIDYFDDVAFTNKVIRLFGTGKHVFLSNDEHDKACRNAVIAFRMGILRKRLRLSLRKFSLILSHSDLYKWFCGINRFSLPKVPSKSTIELFENSIPKNLNDVIDEKLYQALQNQQTPILTTPLDFSKCYFDCTCIKANVHYPVDWLLFKDATRTFMKATARIRKLGLLNRMPCEPYKFISKMNVLCMEMTFAKRIKDAKIKRKNILRKMKKLLKQVAEHAMRHMALLETQWETVNITQNQVAQIIKQIVNISDKLETVIQNAHERIIGERSVKNKDKILSLYEDDVNVIVRKKDGANVEFGNTLYLAEQANGLIVDWKLYRNQAPGETSMVKETYHRIKKRVGIKVSLMASDRGFDSKDNQDFLKVNHIFNALCPRSPVLLSQRMKEDEFCKAQKRRSQTEARISIINHCFCGSPMKQKEFDHRENHMGLSILSHNLWVLARLRIEESQKANLAA